MRGRPVAVLALLTAVVTAGALGVEVPAYALAAPSVTGVSPAAGKTAGGTRVVITGARFSHVRAVKFGTVRGTSLTVVSTSRLKVTTPQHAAGTVHVRVVTSAGTSPIRNADRFTFVAPPKVSSVSPARGRTAGGTRVTIAGANFTKVTAVRFGAVRGTSVSGSSRSLTVIAPAHAAGRVDVRVVTAYGTSPVSAADRFTYVPVLWAGPRLIDPLRGQPTAISCPADDFCMLVDGTGNALTFNGTSWSQPVKIDGDRTLTAVSCAGETFCVAVDNLGYALRFTGAGWTAAQSIDPGRRLTAVSCALQSTFCVAVDALGSAVRFTGSGWVAAEPIDDGNELTGVSCGSPSFCMAVDDAGRAVIYDGMWHAAVQITGMTAFGAVSCVSTTFCVGVGTYVDPGTDVSSGRAVTYTGTWATPADLSSHPLASVSCASTSLCVALDDRYSAVAFGTGTPVIEDLPVWFGFVSCAGGTSFCVAVGDPAGPYGDGGYTVYDGITWSAGEFVDRGAGELLAVSCPSPTFCMAVDRRGNALRFDGTAWTRTRIGKYDELNDVSCASAAYCVVVDRGGHAIVYNGAWDLVNVAEVTPGGALTRVSCASDTFCVAIDLSSQAWRYDGVDWQAYVWPGSDLRAVSCPTPSSCLVIDAAGYTHRLNGTDWTDGPRLSGVANVADLSCASLSYCVAIDRTQSAVFTLDGSWHTTSVGGTGRFVAVSCPSTSFCVAVDATGYASVFDGSNWSTRVSVEPGDLVDVACTSGRFCVALDTAGRAVTGQG